MFSNYSKTISLRHNKPVSTTLAGKLDGMTVLRYTLDTESVGGMEQHAKNINKTLLERNRMTIIQLYLGHNHTFNETTEKIGYGSLIKIPMIKENYKPVNSSYNLFKEISSKFKVIIRDTILDIIYNSVFPIFLKRFLIKKQNIRLKRLEPINAGVKAREIFNKYNVDLVVINFAGGFGSAEVICEAEKRNIPYIIRNAFSNQRFKTVGLREQVSGAAGVGGVYSKYIPKYLKHRYTNLSTGVRIDFFKKENAMPLTRKFDVPLIILAGRITPAKGHKHLLSAANRLKKKGIDFKVVFAGIEELPKYKIELKKLINQYNMSDDIIFAGELSQKEMRDWYAISSVAVLPSRSEGLPRILIEAQAMEVPVIAYDVDGVSEALVNGETGFLVKKGNIKKLSLRIEELILDKKKRMFMGLKGRKYVEEKFSYADFIERHEDFYLSGIKKIKYK